MSQVSIQWPKRPPPLTEQQRKAQADFLKLWHQVLPKKYAFIERFNHDSALMKRTQPTSGKIRTLEIGAGLGEHLEYEDLTHQDYTSVEIRPDFVQRIHEHYPMVKAMVGDVQEKLDLPDASFDRVLAIHVLEHLRDLPRALKEIRRLLKPDGIFVPVIPCEGGLAYGLARKTSAQRIFEKTFKMPYGPIIANEHVSQAWEILHELKKEFDVTETSFWPLKIPITEANLVIALSCRPKRRA